MATPTARPRLSKLFEWSAALAFSLALALVASEIVLRTLRDPERFYPHFPNSERVVYPSEEITPGITGPSQFSTNSFGLRGREPSGRERLRILAIGGSTTADTLLDDSEAWTAILEQQLAGAFADLDSVWVANSGIDGLNSQHHLMHAKYLVPNLPRLDLVLVYSGANDMGLWYHHRDFDPNWLDDPSHWDSRVGEAFRWSPYTPAGYPAFKHTEVWKSLSRLKDRFLTARTRARGREIVQDDRLEWLRQERSARAERAKTLLPEGKLASLPAALDSYAETLNEIASEIEAAGAKPVFVAQVVQSLFRNDAERGRLWMGAIDGGATYVSEEQYPSILALYNERMAEVAHERGALFVDLPKLIANDASIFFDGMHFNEAGARAAGTAVARALLDSGALAAHLPRR